MNKHHGHEVMDMMQESGKSFTKESLHKEIIVRFGQEARFHTCSAQGMDALELIDFLTKKGKFNLLESGITVNTAARCDHDQVI